MKYGDIPQSFVTATISIEDKKFYQHNGVDFKGVVRAAKGMVEAKLKKTQSTQGGASTITMQLAKIMYMKPDKTWQYKVKQMFLAMELEKRYSKEKILEFYLNNEYFANGYYGIDAACHGYFDCELSELDISQVAFLCAIPNSPTYYDPVKNPVSGYGRNFTEPPGRKCCGQTQQLCGYLYILLCHPRTDGAGRV